MTNTDNQTPYSEKYLNLLHETTLEANQAETIEEALRFGLDRICENLDWEIGHLCSYRQEIIPLPTNLWHIQSKTDQEKFRSFIETSELCGEEGLSNQVIKQQNRLWEENVSQITFFKSYRGYKFGFQTAVAVPVWVGNEITAVLEFFSTEVRPLNSQELKVMEDVGTQLGRVVERHQAYQVLRNSERKFRSVFEESGVGMALIDQEFCLIHANKALQAMLGYEEHEILKKYLHEFCFPNDSTQFQEFSNHLFRNHGEVFTTEKRFQKKSGEELWGKVTISYILTDDLCEFAYAILVIEDITDEKKIREEKHELQKELSDLTAYEQRRIGQELHDSVGQDLTGLGFLAKKISGQLKKQVMPQQKDADDLTEGIQNVLNKIREIVSGMIPIEMNANELFTALDNLAKFVETQYNIDCRYVRDHSLQFDDQQKTLQVYRIVQEAVYNAVKHAKPAEILIESKQEIGKIVVTISDDGVGMKQSVMEKGSGLKIMRYRAEMIGGQLSLVENSKGGTTVQLYL